MTYWAVKPKGRGDVIRIERTSTPIQAVRLAFGDTPYRSANLLYLNRDRYEAKNLGTRLAVIQSDRKRMALLKDPTGWFDPWKDV
jgi:hypothetical protein